MSWRREWAEVACLSFAGTALAHIAAFFVVEPDAHHRLDLFEATGHGNWGLAATCAAALVVASCFAALVCGWRGRGRGPALRGLVLSQVVMFLALETTERAVQGADVWAALVQPVVIVGIGLQVVTARLISMLLHAAAAVGQVLRRVLSKVVRGEADGLSGVPVSVVLRDPQGSLGARTPRGPPGYLSI